MQKEKLVGLKVKKHVSRKYVLNAKGFTLIEMTFVLSIVILLTAVIAPFGLKWIQMKAEEDALDSIVAMIYSLQSYSMAHNDYTRLRFKSTGAITSYIAERPGIETFAVQELPEGMCVSESSSVKAVEFSGNGNIEKSGVLTIITKTKRISITFQFQRGRMIIRESERVLLAGSDFDGNCTYGNI